jgi:hypothetical protein
MQLTKADIKAIEAAASVKAVKRKSRTISLDEELFEKFQRRCQERDLAANRVLDMLIAMFLEATD